LLFLQIISLKTSENQVTSSSTEITTNSIECTTHCNQCKVPIEPCISCENCFESNTKKCIEKCNFIPCRKEEKHRDGQCEKCPICNCPRLAKDPPEKSETRQLELLHSLQEDLMKYRKDMDFRTIHKWDPVAFVINLKNRTDRKAQFFEMFDHHKIPPELIPRPILIEAVNSKLMPESDVWKLNGDGFEWKSVVENYERVGAYGCYLSHVKVFRLMLEKYPGKDLILFEDDAYFHPQNLISSLTRTLKNIPSDWELFYIGGTLWTKPVDMNRFGYKAVNTMGTAHSV